jgi:hypothetical protein
MEAEILETKQSFHEVTGSLKKMKCNHETIGLVSIKVQTDI